ncbi:unnamed protein product [Pylaiella littoralis]
MEIPVATVFAQTRLSSSRKRPRCRGVQHVCKGAVLLSLLQFTSTLTTTTASRPGGGGHYHPPGPPQGHDPQDSSFDGGDWGDWKNQPPPGLNPYGMPFSPTIHQRYERPEPMDDLRSFAMSLEEKDRADLGGYIAVVLQKLANMNELFLGERGRKKTVFHSASMPTVAVAEFVERVSNNIACPNLCLMLTLVYMDRLALPSSELHLYVTPLTAHRLFTARAAVRVQRQFLRQDELRDRLSGCGAQALGAPYVAGPCQGRVRVSGRAEPIHGQLRAQPQRDGAVRRQALLGTTSVPLPVEVDLYHRKTVAHTLSLLICLLCKPASRRFSAMAKG